MMFVVGSVSRRRFKAPSHQSVGSVEKMCSCCLCVDRGGFVVNRLVLDSCVMLPDGFTLFVFARRAEYHGIQHFQHLLMDSPASLTLLLVSTLCLVSTPVVQMGQMYSSFFFPGQTGRFAPICT